MNHGSSSLDAFLERKKLSNKNGDTLKHTKSRGVEKSSFKIFPKLKPLEITDQLIDQLAREMHQKPAPSSNPLIPAAYTYFGQFVSHDITIIPKKFSGKSWKYRNQSPCMDLDSVYGKLKNSLGTFIVKNKALFKIAHNNQGEADLPRDPQGSALIADPRNDMSIMISQLHLCFLKFHNAIVRKLQAQKFAGDIFEEAQRISRWHYQWIIVHDYLKRLVGDEILYHKIEPAGKTPKQLRLAYLKDLSISQLPLEFTGAIYRMGHSMIRASYYLNEIPNSRNPRTGRAEAKPIQIFDFEGRGIDLRGGQVLAPYFSLQWNRFLEFPGEASPQYAQRIDTCVTSPMAKIPGDKEKAISMAKQNLKRGKDFELASGQQIAKKMGLKFLKGLASNQETPLWYYVLQEAEYLHQGTQLGPLAGHIVAEVFLAKLFQDPTSFFMTNPAWNPQKEAFIPFTGEGFELKDLVAFAGMPITHSDLEKCIRHNQT